MNDTVARILVPEGADSVRGTRCGVELDLRLLPLESSVGGVRYTKCHKDRDKFEDLSFHF